MELLKAIQDRHSVRKFKNQPVAREILQRVLEAARLAPSASNRQEWRFVVVEDASRRAALSMAANQQRFVGEAAVVIAACAETDEHVMSCGEKCYPIDVAIALEHIALQATDEGLGTCWVGAFNAAKVKEILGIPAHVKVVQLMALGYPADPIIPEKRRKEMKEIVCFEKWSLK
ncbi:MAG: nitroreductase family protein [Candidatus Sumerlaeota bacterium]|nr:nitroreductase family protein [Candidatus Sumerlaeota bacterium]